MPTSNPNLSMLAMGFSGVPLDLAPAWPFRRPGRNTCPDFPWTRPRSNLPPWPCRADGPEETRGEVKMKTLTIGDVTITSIIERDGPWRKPAAMFPDDDPEI